jgi:hypothetical protein
MRRRKRQYCGLLIADEGGFPCLDELERPACIAFANLQSDRPPAHFIKENSDSGLFRRNGTKKAQGWPRNFPCGR